MKRVISCDTEEHGFIRANSVEISSHDDLIWLEAIRDNRVVSNGYVKFPPSKAREIAVAFNKAADEVEGKV